ncbi:MAG: bacteriohemerythrin [Proteobacteria bacterium]|nr:bacteriohemerythrin [Desulfobulbaceae bacterium]MBU4153383.1 bacteriohemerythrin [Pseudomonadota bacterium]
MPIMSWTDTYSVGIAEIDQQHKKLIELINALHDAMAKGQAKTVLGKILSDLITYCASHFALEEKLFDTHGYPDSTDHKDKHHKMTSKVLALQQQFEQGKVTITLDVMDFLQQWLDKHILGTDKKYAPFLNSKGVK